MKNLIFIYISIAILIFSIITLNISPIIKGYIGKNWFYQSYSHYDKYKIVKNLEDSEINTYLSISISNGNKKIEWLDLFKEGKKYVIDIKQWLG